MRRHCRKTSPKWQTDAWKLLFLFTVLALFVGQLAKNLDVRAEFYNPAGDVRVVEVEKIVNVYGENIDGWIATAAKQFKNTKYTESYLKYQLHCLANKESGHRHDNHTVCGDSGKSCGLYQYRKGTWEGFRKIMIKEGLATEIGSLWDDKLQVFTTAWALSNSRHQNWGPWLRGDCH